MEYKITKEQFRLSKKIVDKSNFILSVNKGLGKDINFKTQKIKLNK